MDKTEQRRSVLSSKKLLSFSVREHFYCLYLHYKVIEQFLLYTLKESHDFFLLDERVQKVLILVINQEKYIFDF